MKKIIYSLVIMIAAGSLFTSCIEQVEPLGIQDMRYAKAEYIRALKDLRAADAEYVRAQAAHEQARARYVDAMTANLNADTEYQLLLNEYQELINAAREDTNEYIAAKTQSALDAIKKEIELRELKHQKAMVEAQKDLAEAQEKLRVALRNIALACQDLTSKEKQAVLAAVAAYGIAFEAEAAQEIVVLQAQRTLDSLQFVRQYGPDTVYDKASKAYIGQVEKWKKDIERAEAEQVLIAALLVAVPDSLVYDDIDGWKAQIDKLTEDSTALAYNQYQVKMEMANYYTNYIHDGWKKFNAMITEFNTENPAVAEPTAAQKALIKGGVKTKDDFKVAPHKDSIAFKPFVMKAGEITERSFNKFVYLLSSYNQASPRSKADPKNVFMKLNDGKDSLKIIGPVKQDLKAFIMGKEGDGEKAEKKTIGDVNLVANYGLRGAYSILEREMVTKKDAAKDTAKARKAMEAAEETWSTNREVLINGVAAYVPFQEAKAALATEEAENGQGATKMVNAVKALKEAYAAVDGLNTPDGWDGFDSTEFFNAILAFAKAREEYLGEGYTAPTADFNRLDRSTWDRNVFYYADGQKAGEPILAVKKFTELTYADFQKHDFDLSIEGDGTQTYNDVYGIYDTKYNGLLNIIDQLLGPEFVDALTPTTPSDPMTSPTVTDEGKWALYDVFEVDTWADPKAINEGGAPFIPEELVKAKDTVVIRINQYIDIYNSFWNEAVTTADIVTAKFSYKTVDYTLTQSVNDFITDYLDAMDAGVEDDIAVAEGLLTDALENLCDTSVLDPECYTLETFKPYADKAPIVYYTNTTSIDTTDAMKAVLTAVDPAAAADRSDNTQWDGDIFENQSAIFSGGVTDFAVFMKAAYDYYDALNDKVEEDLAYIKTWIDGVEATFVADDTKDDGTAGYNNWKTQYDAAVKAQADFNKYDAAVREFAGYTVNEDGDTATNAIVGPLTDPSAGTIPGQEFTTLASVLMSDLVEPQNVYGDYPGEWAEGLGGQQLAAAKLLFPDYPVEIMEWDEEITETTDELLHYATLIQAAKKAYFAAAEIADELVNSQEGDAKPTNWDDLVKNYEDANKAYRKHLTDRIEELQKEIEKNEESIALFNNGLPQIDIAIARAENELRVEKEILKGLKQALNYAKENLDRILEYMKSLDGVNFVIPDFTTPTSTTTLP